MAHFCEQAWADFVRGISESPTTEVLRAHLASGCSECTAVFKTWKMVYTIAAHENSFSAPEDVVRMVKQEFALWRAPEPSIWSGARLVFDSFAQPLPAGTRASAAPARQMVYEAEGLTIDLRLDNNPRANRVSIVGQVLDKRSPKALGSACVLLWTAKGHPIVETKANEQGEFQLEFEAQHDLRISIELAGRIPVRIPLASFE